MLLHCIISLQFSRVSSGFMIMESLEYISSQFFVQRNIIPSLIEKNISVFKLFQCPVIGSVLLNDVHLYRINFKLIREVWPDEAQYMIVTQSAKFDGYKGVDPSEIPQFDEGEQEAIAQQLLEGRRAMQQACV